MAGPLLVGLGLDDHLQVGREADDHLQVALAVAVPLLVAPVADDPLRTALVVEDLPREDLEVVGHQLEALAMEDPHLLVFQISVVLASQESVHQLAMGNVQQEWLPSVLVAEISMAQEAVQEAIALLEALVATVPQVAVDQAEIGLLAAVDQAVTGHLLEVDRLNISRCLLQFLQLQPICNAHACRL